MIGTIVNYRLSIKDVQEISAIEKSSGVMMNSHSIGQQVPMIIIRENDTFGSVNGTVFLDGTATMWKTNVFQGYMSGQYSIL